MYVEISIQGKNMNKHKICSIDVIFMLKETKENLSNKIRFRII